MVDAEMIPPEDVPKYGSAVGQRIGPTCPKISEQSDNGHFGPYVAHEKQVPPAPKARTVKKGHRTRLCVC